jgi:hypothetical protein
MLSLGTKEGILVAGVARLSLLGYTNLNLLGRYTFVLREPIAKGEWHPLNTAGQE